MAFDDAGVVGTLLFPDEEVWLEGLQILEGDWVVSVNVKKTSGHRELRLYPPDAACWPSGCARFFGGRPFLVEPFYGGRGGWSVMYPFTAEFSLEDFEPSDIAPDSTLLGVEDTKNNRLMQMRVGGYRLLVPTLTLLSAVALPNAVVLRALLSPGNFGFTVDPASRRSATLVIRCSPWAQIRHKFARRALECLAYWMERPCRRAALNVVFHSVLQKQPIELPRTPDRLLFTCTGYRRGSDIMVERLGAMPGQRVWPRDWKRCELRSTRNTAVMAVE